MLDLLATQTKPETTTTSTAGLENSASRGITTLMPCLVESWSSSHSSALLALPYRNCRCDPGGLLPLNLFLLTAYPQNCLNPNHLAKDFPMWNPKEMLSTLIPKTLTSIVTPKIKVDPCSKDPANCQKKICPMQVLLNKKEFCTRVYFSGIQYIKKTIYIDRNVNGKRRNIDL